MLEMRQHADSSRSGGMAESLQLLRRQGRGFASISNLVPATRVYDVIPPVRTTHRTSHRPATPELDPEEDKKPYGQTWPTLFVPDVTPSEDGSIPRPQTNQGDKGRQVQDFSERPPEQRRSSSPTIVPLDSRELKILAKAIQESEFFQQSGRFWFTPCTNMCEDTM